MERIAIISDIHGNLEALKTVLDDIKKRDIDRIICLGDILAKGRHFSECIKLVKDNCDVVIQGNCDYYFSSFTRADNEVNDKRLRYNRENTSEEERDYLANLPYSYEMKLSGNLVRFYHATPDRINGYVGDMADLDTYYKMFLPSDNTVSQDIADIVVCGHIHKTYMMKVFNRTIVNVGSVGNSFEVYRNKDRDANCGNVTKACYLILGGNIDSDEDGPISYEFVELNYDIDKELSTSEDAYEYDGLVSELKYGLYRDLDSIGDTLLSVGINISDIKKIHND